MCDPRQDNLPPDDASPGDGHSSNHEHRRQAMLEIAQILATRHDLEAMLCCSTSCPFDALDAAETGILLFYGPVRDCLTLRDARRDALDLIHDLLESPAIDAGRVRLEGAPVLLPRLAAEVASQVGRQTERRRIVAVSGDRGDEPRADQPGAAQSGRQCGQAPIAGRRHIAR
ncbi:MAG: hypothetical protein JXA09_06410 [Anaerolineae bacterium]|nr:hypothetical protein [Anaerolineae bacterium]